MMTNIKKHDQLVIFVIPDDPYVHVDTAFEKVLCSLDPLCSERRMERVFGQHLHLGFDLFLHGSRQLPIMLFESLGVCDFVGHTISPATRTGRLLYQIQAAHLKRSSL